MADTAISPAPAAVAAGVNLVGGAAKGNPMLASEVNAFRISAVLDRMAQHIQYQPKSDAVEFSNLCLSLARGIDFAIANQEVPSRVQELPFLLRQVCKRKYDPLLLAGLMVLMISVKNACERGWFSVKDSEDLCKLANEIAGSFCSVTDFTTEPSSSSSIVPAILSRFCPSIKMGHILAFLEAKPGYGAFARDFQISKSMKSSPEDKVRLFVAQTDNIETSSCLVNPPQVNFLLNGKAVEKRTNVFMDPGPQLPTIVSNMLKYGTNLLQAVGQFNGNYIVIVAFMSVTATADRSILQDYVQPAPTTVDPESEIIEGPSRISLNCPISFRRIKTPVKGHLCKHLQCFDFDNYVHINSRRPSWRCPHCNQYVCFTDIRVDQNMVKVLEEVGKDVTDVIISSDGSWKAIMESDDDRTDKPRDKTPRRDEPLRLDSAALSNTSADICDLTDMDDEMETVSNAETEDRKFLRTESHSQSNIQNAKANSLENNSIQVNSNTSFEDGFWSGVYLSPCESEMPTFGQDPQAGGVCGPTSTTLALSPVLTDAISPSLNQGVASVGAHTTLPISISMLSQNPPSSLQLQQFQFGNANISNEYGIFPSSTRNISRTPIAVQALPAQPSPSAQQRLRNNMINLLQNGALANSPRSFSRPPQMGHIPSSSSQQFQGATRPTQQIGLQAPKHLSGAYRVPPAPSTGYQASNSQRLNQSHTPASAISSRAHIRPGGSHSGAGQAPGAVSQQARLMASQQASQMARTAQTSRTTASHSVNSNGSSASFGEWMGNVGRAAAVIQTNAVPDLSEDLNWRPDGRMRGSLQGRAYSDALSQFNIQPPRQTQSPRPPSSNLPPTVSSVSPRLEVLLANRAAHAAVDRPITSPPSTSNGTGVFPGRSSGMS